MNLPDSTVQPAPLLGVTGIGQSTWAASYFPEDLPPDWRLDYLANDCDCLLLPSAAWCDDGDPAAAAGWGELLRDPPESLRLFLQLPADTVPSTACLERFSACAPALLVERPVPLPVDWPQWRADGADQWVDVTGSRMIRWRVDAVDLRAWRTRAEGLGVGVRALVLDGPAGAPPALRDLRMILQILGIA